MGEFDLDDSQKVLGVTVLTNSRAGNFEHFNLRRIFASLGRRTVHWNPFSCMVLLSSNKKDPMFGCHTAMVLPCDNRILKMLPSSRLIDVAGLHIASNYAIGHKAHCWTLGHTSWIVVKLTASFLSFPEFY